MGVGRPGFKRKLWHLLGVTPWAHHFMSALWALDGSCVQWGCPGLHHKVFKIKGDVWRVLGTMASPTTLRDFWASKEGAGKKAAVKEGQQGLI